MTGSLGPLSSDRSLPASRAGTGCFSTYQFALAAYVNPYSINKSVTCGGPRAETFSQDQNLCLFHLLHSRVTRLYYLQMPQKSKREPEVSAWGVSCRVSSVLTRSSDVGHTYVLVVPTTGVELLQGSRGLPGLQKEIHLVLLPPAQGLAQHVPGLVQVEVSCPQEAQDVLIFGDLRDREGIRPQNGTSNPSDEAAEMTLLPHLQNSWGK